MEVIAKNEKGFSEYDREKGIVHYQFSGMFNAEKTKELTKEVLSFAQQNRINGICTDLSNMQGTFTSLSEYFAKEYFPPLIQQGLKCQSIIVPHDIFTQFAAESIVKKMGEFTMQTFSNKDKAHSWLHEKLSA